MRTWLKNLGRALAATMVASLVTSMPMVAAADDGRPAPDKQHPVATRPVGTEPFAPETPNAPLPEVKWPDAGSITVTSALPGKAAGAQVQVLDREQTAKANVDGLLVRVAGSGKLTVKIDYNSFAHAGGGDWGTRLRMLRLPDCSLSTPDKPECAPQPVPGSWNDTRAGQAGGEVEGGALVALAAGSAGPMGDYTATSLSPSATWQVSPQSGDFSWSYPIRVPPPAAGPSPSIGLSYSSGSVDGRTASTNNQPSWIGEGFDFWPGYIERKYKPCGDDGQKGDPPPGDLCWGGDNATLSLNGGGGELVYNAKDKLWHPKNDDGMKVQHLTGAPNADNDKEYWRVTVDDGTQYYFGKTKWNDSSADTNSVWTVPVAGNGDNEPCHGTTFAGSFCTQAWRWNLDYVVDLRGNAMALYYGTESNNYAKNKDASPATPYIRGGFLKQIDYGLRTSAINAANPPHRVEFTVKERCLSTSSFNCEDASKFTEANKSHWPDVPFDQNCANGKACTNKNSPTFWSRKRLTEIKTHVWNGSAYDPVDLWEFDQKFPPSGDRSDPSLWLDGITHTGKLKDSLRTAADLAMPKVVFKGTQKPNRVDGSDSLPPYTKRRITSIENEAGGVTTIAYSEPECRAGSEPKPESNEKRCFPQRILRPAATDPDDLITDWMHKYVVTQVSQEDKVGGSPATVTGYQYLDTPAWHYTDSDPLTPAKYKTWSEWRGYSKVRVLQGSPNETQSRTDYLYYRGMHGDRADPIDPAAKKLVRITDSDGVPKEDDKQLQGFLREEISYNGANGSVVSGAINTPWVSGPTAKDGSLEAWRTDTAQVRARVKVQNGQDRVTQIDKNFNDDGTVDLQHDRGDVSTPADDRCTHYTYTSNDDKGIQDLASRQWTDAVACGTTPRYPDDAISDVKTDYDMAYGEPTTTWEVDHYEGSTPHYTKTKRYVHDALGRVKETYDALDHGTFTSYTPAAGSPVTAVTTKNALGHAQTETRNILGSPVKTEDANKRVTKMMYDPLGRLANVWLPGRSTDSTPNAEFEYKMDKISAPVVTSKELLPYGGQKVTYQLYDGQLRPRQVQGPTTGSGRVLSDVYYDSRGLAWKANQPYYDKDNPPAGTLVVPQDDNQVPSQTLTTFDGAGRATANTLYSFANRKWGSSAVYSGDRVSTTPPEGGVPTTTVTNARGQTTELWQHKDNGIDKTAYSYTKSGQVESVMDPVGHRWKYGYDLRGNQTSIVDPDQGLTETAYDLAGEATSVTTSRKLSDGSRQKLGFTYDALGRRTSVFDHAAPTVPLVSWKYDSLALGKLTSSTRYSGGQQYTSEIVKYDEAYRPLESKVTIPTTEGNLGKSYTSKLTYNLDGGVETLTMPAAGTLSEETIRYNYNGLGLLTSMTGAVPYALGADYTEFGERYQLQVGTSTSKSIWFTDYHDPATRRVAESRVDRTNIGAADDDRHYDYDPVGNIRKIANNGDVQCFGMDSLQRLTQVWTPAVDNCDPKPTKDNARTLLGGPAPSWQSFSYGTTGNRTASVDHDVIGDVSKDITKTYGYDENGADQPNTLTSVTTVQGGSTSRDTFTYDTPGNMIQRVVGGNTTNLGWNQEGRLAQVTKNGTGSTYLYDADGDLLLSRQPGKTTLYLDGQELSMNSAGDVTATRYYEHSGQKIAVRTANSLKFLVADHQGTAQLTIDSASLAITRRYFTPFGQTRGSGTAWPDQRGFLGAPKDAVTDLTHLGAREYDPDTGRFISVDPVFAAGDLQSFNGYAYSNNNPVTLSDPSGLRVVSCNGRMVDERKCNPRSDGHGGYSMGPDRGAKCYGNCSNSGYGYNPATSVTRKQLLEQQAAAMRAKVAAAQARLKNSVMGIVKIAADILGITAGIDCFTQGNVGACAETALNVLLSSVGGIVGKIIAKYGAPWKWAKGGRLVKKIWNLVKDAGSAILDFARLGKQARAAEDAAKAADDIPGLSKVKSARRAGGSCHSFPPGTKVLLADGTTKPIENVKIGDTVLTNDPIAARTEAHPVVATWAHENEPARTELTMDTDGTAGSATATITATDWHPLWIANLKAWLPAASVQAGTWLQTSSGTWVQVTAVRHITVTGTTYDLTVGAIHSYHVLAGATPVLVHNCDPSDELVELANDSIGQTNTASEVVATDGTVGHGTSMLRAPEDLTPQVRNAAHMTDHHRGCSEIGGLCDLERQGAPLAGARPKTVKVMGGSQAYGVDEHMEDYPMCDSCRELFGYLAGQ